MKKKESPENNPENNRTEHEADYYNVEADFSKDDILEALKEHVVAIKFAVSVDKFKIYLSLYDHSEMQIDHGHDLDYGGSVVLDSSSKKTYASIYEGTGTYISNAPLEKLPWLRSKIAKFLREQFSIEVSFLKNDR